MTTEAWFRNPSNYIRELVETGEYKIAWDRGILVKQQIDPYKHAQAYFGLTYPWRSLLVGEQGTAELREGHDVDKPFAVYPTWVYGEEGALLEEILAYPPGEDAEACMDTSVGRDERPVWGQEHRVVITEAPKGNTGAGRHFYRWLKTLQEDYPKAIIHVHGLYGWRLAFGMGFGASDVDPRVAAQKGRVHLPSGKEEVFEHVQKNAKWVTALGFKPTELSVPRNRCMYNIKSAVWAGANYDALYSFKTTSNLGAVDTESSDEEFVPDTGKVMNNGTLAKVGDKSLCNSCSLQNDCKYYREGAVCSLPGSETTKLAEVFKSRDASRIIDGLGTLVAKNVDRMERGLKYEEIDGEIDPNVSRMVGQVFDQGVKLAKLIDPNLAGGTKIQINNGTAGTTIQQVSPRQFMAAAMRELEDSGIPRESITEEMLGAMLQRVGEGVPQRQVIGELVQGHVERENDL